MAYADIVFKEMCRDILENGYDTKGEKVRPVWTDTGEKAYTIKRFGVVNRYDLKKEFPALTLRKTPIKSATDELLWIWQKKSNNIKDLASHVWDEWADENGSIGSAYGYQIGLKYIHHKLPEGGEDLSSYPSAETVEKDGKLYVKLDQTDGVLYDLRNNPYSRRIMTNIYNFYDLSDMHLYPCAYSMTFNVTKNDETGKLVLNGILNQRSQDVLAANNWNVCQYAVLIHMFAQVCDMEVGEFVHVMADCHIYDRHVDAIRELLSREPFEAPKFRLNPDIKDFYQFTKDDVRLDDYQTGPQITNIPIAV
ncbi:MAG: thymidylate synthase [Parasporobacterium sp.]|nr:thymidylate synthase [Parasporobacterium sp.]